MSWILNWLGKFHECRALLSCNHSLQPGSQTLRFFCLLNFYVRSYFVANYLSNYVLTSVVLIWRKWWSDDLSEVNKERLMFSSSQRNSKFHFTLVHVKKDRTRNIMNGEGGEVFKTADNVCYLERKQKREEREKKMDVTILAARFLVKFEARSSVGSPQLLLCFYPLFFLLCFNRWSRKPKYAYLHNLRHETRDDLIKLKRTCTQPCCLY